MEQDLSLLMANFDADVGAHVPWASAFDPNDAARFLLGLIFPK
ncbi:hypothetical protein [Luteimonas fraxinea]|nr:hypothetical protein [Luteimonas fraxinea]